MGYPRPHLRHALGRCEWTSKRSCIPAATSSLLSAVTAIAGAAIFSAPGPGFPVLHTILNTGIALATVAVSLLFWDLGWRTGEIRVRFLAIVFAVAGVLEVLHVMAALEPSSASEELNAVVHGLRSGTWAPPAYLLPLGTAIVLWWKPTPTTLRSCCSRSARWRRPPACLRCSSRCRVIPSPDFSASSARRSLAVPLLWIPVGITLWRRRHGDRIAHALAYYALAAALAHSLMLYSDEATSKFAMTAHFGVFAGGLFLLFSLMQMGTADTARRMRAEEELLQSINEALEVRVAARTAELAVAQRGSAPRSRRAPGGRGQRASGCTTRCARPMTICGARRRRCSNTSGCARSARWRAASRTTSTTRSRRSRSMSMRCSRTKPDSVRAPASSSPSSSARSTTSRTRWRAWASSTASVPRSSSWRRCPSTGRCATCSI